MTRPGDTKNQLRAERRRIRAEGIAATLSEPIEKRRERERFLWSDIVIRTATFGLLPSAAFLCAGAYGWDLVFPLTGGQDPAGFRAAYAVIGEVWLLYGTRPLVDLNYAFLFPHGQDGEGKTNKELYLRVWVRTHKLGATTWLFGILAFVGAVVFALYLSSTDIWKTALLYEVLLVSLYPSLCILLGSSEWRSIATTSTFVTLRN